jgi:hypothetical protein
LIPHERIEQRQEFAHAGGDDDFGRFAESRASTDSLAINAATAAAALLFSQWLIVQRRQYALKQIDNYMVDADFSSDWLAPIGVNPLRRLLGDQAIRVIYLPARRLSSARPTRRNDAKLKHFRGITTGWNERRVMPRKTTDPRNLPTSRLKKPPPIAVYMRPPPLVERT